MSRWSGRLGWIAATTLAVMVVASYAADAIGGPLDPVGSPAPTLTAFDNIATSWHRVLPANDNGGGCSSSRFGCVMNDEAVLDRETGLVWQRDLGANPRGFSDWAGYMAYCTRLFSGSRYGWRAPTIEELATLNPVALPAGNPFTNSPADWYWSSTTDPANSANALTIDEAQTVPFSRAKSSFSFTGTVICVRAPGAA